MPLVLAIRVRYAGVFAPAAKWRSAIVPTAAATTSSTQAESTVVSRGVETSGCLNDSSANFIQAAMLAAQPSSLPPHASPLTLRQHCHDEASNRTDNYTHHNNPGNLTY
jgi:hypothetical protein